MVSTKRRNLVRSVLLAVVIIIAAICLTSLTSRAFPGPEKPINERCLIEDCIAGGREAGFPLRVVTLDRYEGLNCGGFGSVQNVDAKCTTTEPKSIVFFVGNFVFYGAVLTLITYIVINRSGRH